MAPFGPAPEAADHPFTELELTKIAAGLLVAGFDTTAGIITYGILALLDSPDQFALLRDDPAQAPNAAEDIRRLLSNGTGLTRVATVGTVIAGTAITVGDFVVAANHDPDPLAVTSSRGAHLGFRPRPAPMSRTTYRATGTRHAAAPNSVAATGRAVRRDRVPHRRNTQPPTLSRTKAAASSWWRSK